MDNTDNHCLAVESTSDGSDDFIRSRCSCGWEPRWEHWAFSGEIHPAHMLILVLFWRAHAKSCGASL